MEHHRIIGRASECKLLLEGLFAWLFHWVLRCLLWLLHLLQLLIQQSRLFQFHRQILATVLKAPVESDGEGAEGDDDKGFKEIDNRKLITLYAVIQYEMAVETDAQSHKRRIDKLKPEIAADDVFDAFLERPRHLDNVLQDDVRQHTDKETYYAQSY